MIQNANCCGVSRIEEIVCEDRISALPEDLLVMILDLVPTKDAVATMFLSKRWVSVWTMKQRLEYIDDDNNSDGDYGDDDSDGDNSDDDDDDDDEHEHVDSDDDEHEHVDSDDDEHEHVDSDDDEHEHVDSDDENENEDQKVEDESKKSVWWFLEKSLQLHRAPVISNLCIELGPSCPTDADVGKLVANAVDRWVLEMKLKLLWSADPASLPKTLYSCQSLVTLTLSNRILVDVPSSASLPYLTTLKLHYVVYNDDDSLVKLLSSCPVLEKLFVKRNKKDDNVTRFRVEMPNLLFLSYKNLRDDSGVADTGRYLVIVTSALTQFEIFDASGDSRSMEMPSLDSAIVAIASYPDDKFLRCLLSVSSLALYLTPKTVVWCSTIKFSRLRRCWIYPLNQEWMKSTILFLQNSPKLKYLMFNCRHTFKDLPLSWIQPSSVPGCLSSQLKVFEWYAYVGREEEEQILTYLLANSNCLKTATISLRLPTCEFESDFELAKEMTMDGLKDIPRVSTESQLVIKVLT